MSYKFISEVDELSQAINKACNDLLVRVPKLDIDSMPFEPDYKTYFKKCHFDRQYFSLRTGGKLIYQAIKATNKSPNEITLMDYGAGLSSVYLIAKLIGVKQVIYNDLMQDFATPAKAINDALGIPMDLYIVGDTLQACKNLKALNIQCDVIVSRNVIEHVYDLKDFYETLYKFQPQAILYQSTTANWKNPLAHIQHVFFHLKNTEQISRHKANFITSKLPNVEGQTAFKLAKKLRVYGSKELEQMLAYYAQHQSLPKLKKDYTNIANYEGNWCEHLLPYSAYTKFSPNYSTVFLPGIWDVHYKNPVKKYFGMFMDTLTKILGKAGVISAGYIFVVSKPKQ